MAVSRANSLSVVFVVSLLARAGKYIRWEVALVDDGEVGGLDFVPGSHNRLRTDVENEVLMASHSSPAGQAAFADIPPHKGSPGSMLVPLKAGQAVFWTGDCMHRGRTAPDHERLALSCSWPTWTGMSGMDLPDPTSPAGQAALKKAGELIPLHEWKIKPHVRDGMPTEWMKRSWDRWIATQLEVGMKKKGVYSVDRFDV